nr:uncharacterized protein si:ch73-6k14.2 [Nothobranchius furzeri]
MKPRCLLSIVDRLPTISEMQESDSEDGDLNCSSHTMEDYVDSIRELSQPACYPLHGPLRGHRRWMVRTCSGGTSWLPVDPSEVSLILTGQSSCGPSLRFRQNLVDVLVSPSLLAGLV